MIAERHTSLVTIVTIVDAAVVLLVLLGQSSNLSSLTVARSTISVAYNEAQAVLIGAVILGTLIPTVLSFALMLHYHRKVIALKKSEGWKAQGEYGAALFGEGEIPQPLPMKWNMLYIPVLIFTALFGILSYPLLPDMVAMHADFSGNVTDYMEKSPAVVVFPLLVQAFLAACFVVCHWTILRSKKPLDSERPVTSALAYGMFARAQTLYLFCIGIILCIAVGILFMLSSLNWISLGLAGGIIVVIVIGITIPGVVISLVYGQSGARVLRHLNESDVMTTDDDAHWKLGVFYWNPEDPSLVLPERFGIGWTFNLARPAMWAIIEAFVVVTALFVAGVYALVGV